SSVAVSKSNCISISAAAVGTTIAASKSAAIRQKRMYTFLALFSPGPAVQPALYYTVFHAFMQERYQVFSQKERWPPSRPRWRPAQPGHLRAQESAILPEQSLHIANGDIIQP